MKMRITYNAPVVLTFTLFAIVVMVLGTMTGNTVTEKLFLVYPFMDAGNPLDYFRLFSHVLGHHDWGHLIGNFTFILLLGPGLEEKYGSLNLLEMIAITALATGLATVFLFPNGLYGASGIVFMMILLGSFVNARAGEIPLTFLIIAILFIGKEVVSAFGQDSISQMAHILGGLCGAAFGWFRAPAEAETTNELSE